MVDRSAGDLAPEREEWLTLEEAAAALRIDPGELATALGNGTGNGQFPDHLIYRRGSQIRIHRSIAFPNGTEKVIAEIQAEIHSLGLTLQALTDDVRRLRTGAGAPAPALGTTIPLTLSRPAARPRRPLIPARAQAVVERFRLTYALGGAIAIGVLGWILLSNLGANPAGFFCDEAEIGVHTRTLVLDDLTAIRPRLFYQHFAYEHLGALPLYAGAPVIAVLGLSDMSVRLVSVIWSVAALIMLVALVRRLRWRHGEIAVVLFACTPVFIHIARINVGHAPSLFCVCAGLYAYVRGREEGTWRWSALGGLALAASIYGHAAYYFAAPVVVAGLAVGEFTTNRLRWRAWRPFGIALAAFAVAWLPVLFKALTDDQFLKRFREKDVAAAPLFSWERLGQILDEYPKYFSFDYLFRIGEVGMPGGWNFRHSVPGAGILTWIVLPLIVAGIVAIFRDSRGSSRVVAVTGLVVLILYPVPDLITTTSLNPPYTFTTFATLIFVPLLAGMGVHWLSQRVKRSTLPRWANQALPLGLLAIILFGGARFYTGPYDRYPLVSAGYEGWQYGAGPSIDVFERYPDRYDRYVLDGDFNGAFIFLDFYLAENPELRGKSIIGGLEKVDLGNRDLYAIRAPKYDSLMSSPGPLRRYMQVIDTVRFPSGEIALYLVEIGPVTQGQPGQLPF